MSFPTVSTDPTTTDSRRMLSRRAVANGAGAAVAALAVTRSSRGQELPSGATPAATPGTSAPPPPPMVDPATLRTLAPGIHVIEDRYSIPLVPNITIVEGEDSVLVVDAGLGPRNGQIVHDIVRNLVPDLPIYLTFTHFHPEHGFGAQAFRDDATILYNQSQLDEFRSKRDAYVTLFGELGVGDFFEGLTFVEPDIAYDGATDLDLGGRMVTMRTVGPAHTLGDQIIEVPDAGVAVLGDLLETNAFPIYPWFPDLPDTDIDPVRWLAVLRDVESTRPEIVVPGHGPVTTLASVTDLAEYIAFAREQALTACQSAASLEEATARLTPVLRAARPDWMFPEWIEQHIATTYGRECQ